MNELEGMARAAYNRPWYGGKDKERWGKDNDAEHRLELCNDMKAALLWLADNVTDEMAHTAAHERLEGATLQQIIGAALRAAAGEP